MVANGNGNVVDVCGGWLCDIICTCNEMNVFLWVATPEELNTLNQPHFIMFFGVVYTQYPMNLFGKIYNSTTQGRDGYEKRVLSD